MKRIFAALLAMIMALTLCACAKDPEPVVTTTQNTAPEETTVEETTVEETTVEETTVEETAAPVVLYRNPLNGTPLEEPWTTRFFSVTINNVSYAMPHCGVSQADLFFEMFINDYATRGYAFFSDISQVEAIGSVRSHRFPFTDLAQSYHSIGVHAGGSDAVMADLNNSVVEHLYAEVTAQSVDYDYRDQSRLDSGYAWEHTLFVRGDKLQEAATSKGYDITQDGSRNYGMVFSEYATISDGETANKIGIKFLLYGHSKTTEMEYDASTGKYNYCQFGQTMVDGNNGEKEQFSNVFVILADTHNEVHSNNTYHIPDILGSGDGYYACGGSLIPIQWHRASDDDSFSFTLTDGSQLVQAVGNSYIAIAPTGSEITWE